MDGAGWEHGVLNVTSYCEPEENAVRRTDPIAPLPQDFPEGNITLGVVSVLICQLGMN